MKLKVIRRNPKSYLAAGFGAGELRHLHEGTYLKLDFWFRVQRFRGSGV